MNTNHTSPKSSDIHKSNKRSDMFLIWDMLYSTISEWMWRQRQRWLVQLVHQALQVTTLTFSFMEGECRKTWAIKNTLRRLPGYLELWSNPSGGSHQISWDGIGVFLMVLLNLVIQDLSTCFLVESQGSRDQHVISQLFSHILSWFLMLLMFVFVFFIYGVFLQYYLFGWDRRWKEHVRFSKSYFFFNSSPNHWPIISQ